MSRWVSGDCEQIGQTRKEDFRQDLRGRTRGRLGRNESSGSDEPSAHADYQSSDYQSFTEHAHEDGAEAEWERYRSTCPLSSTTLFFSSPRRVRATTRSLVGDRVVACTLLVFSELVGRVSGRTTDLMPLDNH